MSDEISHVSRMMLRSLQTSVQHALDDGLDPELILDAVAAGLQRDGLESRGFGSSPLSMSLTRAFNSSVGPEGEAGPTEGTTTSAGPDDVALPASPGTPRTGPGPAEALTSDTERR